MTLAHLVIAAAADRRGRREQRRDVLTDEYIDVLLAYLEAKFPGADHPAWTDPDVAVQARCSPRPTAPSASPPPTDARLRRTNDERPTA